MVLDEFGYEPLNREEASLLFRVVNYRHAKNSSMAITTNKQLKQVRKALIVGTEVPMEILNVSQKQEGASLSADPTLSGRLPPRDSALTEVRHPFLHCDIRRQWDVNNIPTDNVGRRNRSTSKVSLRNDH